MRIEEPRMSPKEKEKESVARIQTLLSDKKHFPWIIGIRTTNNFDAEDMVGVDMVLQVSEHFSEITELPTLAIQIKSSETGVDQFVQQGKQHARSGASWWDKRLVVLDAGWGNDMICADFIAQIINLIGFWGNEFEIEDFFVFLPLHPNIVRAYRAAMAQDLVAQHRRDVLQLSALPQKRNKQKNK